MRTSRAARQIGNLPRPARPRGAGLRSGLLPAAAAMLALAACDPATMARTGAGPSRANLDVAGRTVAIAPPPGFCIDPESVRTTTAGAFVLMSDCGLLGAKSASKSMGAAMTASVSTGGFAGEGDTAAGSLEDLADFASSREGRAVLGRSGQPDRVRILNSQISGGALYVLVEDRGSLPIAGIDRQFWRAFLEVNGRLVALSLLGFEGAGLSPQRQLDQLAALAAAIRAANSSRG